MVCKPDALGKWGTFLKSVPCTQAFSPRDWGGRQIWEDNAMWQYIPWLRNVLFFLQRILLALSEDLETVVMVSDILLVYWQHWKQHVKQVTWIILTLKAWHCIYCNFYMSAQLLTFEYVHSFFWNKTIEVKQFSPITSSNFTFFFTYVLVICCCGMYYIWLYVNVSWPDLCKYLYLKIDLQFYLFWEGLLTDILA